MQSKANRRNYERPALLDDTDETRHAPTELAMRVLAQQLQHLTFHVKEILMAIIVIDHQLFQDDIGVLVRLD